MTVGNAAIPTGPSRSGPRVGVNPADSRRAASLPVVVERRKPGPRVPSFPGNSPKRFDSSSRPCLCVSVVCRVVRGSGSERSSIEPPSVGASLSHTWATLRRQDTWPGHLACNRGQAIPAGARRCRNARETAGPGERGPQPRPNRATVWLSLSPVSRRKCLPSVCFLRWLQAQTDMRA